jgi:GAF domain-containing protein/HAMP domain-containing protein
MAISDQPGSHTKTLPDQGFDPGVENRIQSIRLLTIFVCVLSAALAAGLGILLFSQFAWQIVILAGLFAVTALFCLVALNSLYPRNHYIAGITITSLLFGLSVLGIAALLSGMGFPAAIVYLIFTLIVSSTTLDDRQANLAIIIGILIAGLAGLANDFSPFPQAIVGLVTVLTPAILGVLFMVYMTMQAMQFVTATLRIRLVTIFMAIVIIPLSILSIVQSGFMFNELTREANQAQKQASQQTAFAVEKFIQDTQGSVLEAAQLPIFSTYLELSKEQRIESAQEKEMQLTMKVLDANELRSTMYLSSFALLDMDGLNLYDTLRDRFEGMLSPDFDLASGQPGQGTQEGTENYFLVPARSGVSYISQVYIVTSTRGFFYVSAPVKNLKGQVVGVLRARYDGQLLQDLLKQYNGLLGSHSYPILLDNNNIRLADQFTPINLYKSIAPLSSEQVRLLKSNQQLPNLPDSLLSTNFGEFSQLINKYTEDPLVPAFRTEISLTGDKDQSSEIAAVTKVNGTSWKLVYLRTDFSDEDLRRNQRRLTTLVTIVIAGIVGLIAVGAAQLLSSPIMRLTRTAQLISEGDLEAQAPFQSSDEFGMLGNAFNSMTTQLRALIAQLEDRIRARTQEIENQNEALTHRAAQLQTVSEVARQIVSAQELEALLSSVTQLISDRFDFYHVGIFLMDEKKENAVLRAANSEGGQRMLARHHSLPVGKIGIVGYATGSGEARIATDVGEDAVFFNNPDLPDTRSEMALPLKVGDQVIGAIDIQSTHPNAFRADDIELFSTLADQVAIAIYNNQLYMETLHALDEAHNLHRQYLRSEWAQDTAQRKVLGYVFNESGISPQLVENPLWRKVFTSGDPLYAVLPSSNGSPNKAVMAVPIAVRGETIGVIHVQDQGENRLWSEDEISVVNSIAAQVAVALENARLFENTIRRAEREKKVLQITAKIRSTNDPEEMMRIAVSELQQALNASRTQIYIRQEEEENE